MSNATKNILRVAFNISFIPNSRIKTTFVFIFNLYKNPFGHAKTDRNLYVVYFYSLGTPEKM